MDALAVHAWPRAGLAEPRRDTAATSVPGCLRLGTFKRQRHAPSRVVVVKSTPEFGLLAEHVSTAQARSAGGQRHFRPPGARYHAPIAMRASAPGQVDYGTTVASCVQAKTTSYTHKSLRISCKFLKYLDKILKSLETLRNNPRLIVQQAARASCNGVFGGHPLCL
jgi:hypothetical protein